MLLTSLGTTGSVGTPRWSPDGSTIAFDFSAQGEDSNADILVVSASGGSVRQITQAPSSDVTPTWSSDGRWIFFMHQQEESDLMLVEGFR